MAISYGTYTIAEVQEGSQIWTTTTAPSSPNYTFTVSKLVGDSDTSIKAGDIVMYSYYRYTVLSISNDGTTVLTGNRQSIRGGTGAASVTYTLILSSLAIVKDKNGDISPTTITLTSKSQTGSNAMANYSGRFVIETTTDNSTWTTQYTSSSNEATYTWTVIDNIVAIRCSLYLAGGTTTLLDQQTIPVISDGIDGTNGTNGKDAYTIILTNENHTFAGDTTSAIASEIECNVIAYKGATQVASTIGTITGQPTGMTTSLLNNGTVNAAFKVNVTTSMVTKSGVLTVPITVDGKSFTKEFTYTLTLDGEDGKDGGRWYSGTNITGTSTTATVFSGSGITLAVVGDMYLNTDTYNTYQCTLGGNASTAKWKYVNNIKGGIGDTGKGVSSITNQYYLSTSNSTQTGGSWSNTVPSYVSGRYYWTRSHIVWSDNTQTDTTPVLDNGLTDANSNAINARKVATNYLSMDSTGIMVADLEDGEQTPSEATGNNVFIDNTSVNIRDGQTTLASFGVDGMQIGLSNESHTNQDYHSWQMIDKEGNIYVNISDLRDTTGVATVTEKDVSLTTVQSQSNPTLSETYIDLSFKVSSIISVTINDTPVSSFSIVNASFGYISTTPFPAEGDSIVVVYTSPSDSLKAYSLGIRRSNTDIGAFSFIEGYNTTASGHYSHAEGNNSIASGRCSHAEGYGRAKGTASHAEGSSEATGQYSHAEGSSIAQGMYSHAEGDSSNAFGVNAHAENASYAAGFNSHAEGASNAYGEYSHSEGYQTGADGNYSHAQNFGTQAKGEAQTAIGKFNIEDTNNTYAFIIGNGVDDSNRSNALTVKWDGTITAANGFSTDNVPLTITRDISTTYMNDTAFNRIKAYRKNGMLYLCFNAEFTSAYSVSNYTTIATISGWKAVFDAYAAIPRQTDGSKILMLLVRPEGRIQVYSTSPISGWHRASICIPCSS